MTQPIFTGIKLTDAQVKLGLSFIDRVGLEPHYRLLTQAQRYDRMLDLVRIALEDPLIGKDYGVEDLIAVARYFNARHLDAIRREVTGS